MKAEGKYILGTETFQKLLIPWSVTLFIVYLVSIPKFKEFLRNRDVNRKAIKQIMLCYNAFNLIIHSFIVIFLLPDFLYHFFKGPYSIACNEGELYTNRHSRWSVGMFTLSKSWLLFDTFITISLSKELDYGSIIHHGLVLLQVGFTYKISGASARLPIMLNSLLGTLTYFYFVALHFDMKVNHLRRYIIMGQRWQFIIGLLFIGIVKSWKNRGYDCEISYLALDFNLFIYITFLVLSFLKS
uniref:Elongation of very long chain fatty acids protein n=1 Tax=Strongyloides papillosus TaxID=174720 RepID=A0A0N5BKB1_STREA